MTQGANSPRKTRTPQKKTDHSCGGQEEKLELTLKIKDEIISKSSRMRSSRGSLTDCSSACTSSSSSSSTSGSPSSPSSPSSSVVSSRSASPEPRHRLMVGAGQAQPRAGQAATRQKSRLYPSSVVVGSDSPGFDECPPTPENSPNRFAQLTYEQVVKLETVLEEVVPVHGRGNFPTLEVKLKDLVRVVRTRLEKDSIRVRDIRLNGGAAISILSSENTPYNDLDVIFSVDLSGPRAFDKVKTAVLDSLLDFMPEGVCKKRIGGCILKEAYVHKMVKVPPREPGKGTPSQHHPNGDRWSLISLSNNRGRNVELKFVDTMRRQFEFSVDSFQIILDSLLTFYGCAGQLPEPTEHFYPTVVGESVYGDFDEALYHLEEKLISTRRPEEIRGGGLLKYCHLLVKGYRPAKPAQIKRLERYMCSRFFIDFGDLQQQKNKLEAYLTNHFVGDVQLRCEYLATLYAVVDESTICLMGHERRQTLCLIQDLCFRVYYFDQQRRLVSARTANVPATTTNHDDPNKAMTFSPAAAALVAGGGRFVLNGAIFYTPYMPTTGYCATPTTPTTPTATTDGASNYGVCACGWLNCR